MSDLELLIAPEVIRQKIKEVAKQVDAAYVGQELTLVAIMKGAVCLVADLLRELKVPCTLELVRASSYGERGIVQGDLTVVGAEALRLQGKHVLLIDDIFDTGLTLHTIAEELELQQPLSLKTLVLLCKRVPRTLSYVPDYALFHIEDRFVVGYGLDYKELYRGLPGIYASK